MAIEVHSFGDSSSALIRPFSRIKKIPHGSCSATMGLASMNHGVYKCELWG